MKIFLTLFLILALAGSAWATDYYFSNSGSDAAACTSGAKCKTMSKANSISLTDGETMYFDADSVWRFPLIPPAGGTAAAVTYKKNGTGDDPRITGTVPLAPTYIPARNLSLEDFTGTIDDTNNDTWLPTSIGWATSGDITRAVTATGTTSPVAAMLQHGGTAKGNLTLTVYLPASTDITVKYAGKATTSAGTVQVRKSGGNYLQTNGTWAAGAAYPAAIPVGASYTTGITIEPEGAGHGHFTTDTATAQYLFTWSSYNSSGRPSYVTDISITGINWSNYSGYVYKIPIAYAPKVVLAKYNGVWIPGINGANLPVATTKDTLGSCDVNGSGGTAIPSDTPGTAPCHTFQWVYEAPYLYVRDDTGVSGGAAPALEMEVSVPGVAETGIFNNAKNYVTVDGIDVTGWPGTNASTTAAGGIGVAGNPSHFTLQNSRVAGNLRRGVEVKATASTFTGNTYDHNGANGFAFIGTGNVALAFAATPVWTHTGTAPFAEAAGTLTASGNGTASTTPTSALTFESGRQYMVIIPCDTYTSGTYTVTLGNQTTAVTTPAASTKQVFYLTPTANLNTFTIDGNNGAHVFVLTSISIIALPKAGEGNTSTSNEAKFNGWWNLAWASIEDDGEGIGAGTGTGRNTYTSDYIHNNCVAGKSSGFTLWQSNNNTVSKVRVDNNYGSGISLYGDANIMTYSYSINNGVGRVYLGAKMLWNLKTANFDGKGSAGGNKIQNCDFLYGYVNDAANAYGNLYFVDDWTANTFQNNIIWGTTHTSLNNLQLGIAASGVLLTGGTWSNNCIGPESTGFIHWHNNGNDYNTLAAFNAAHAGLFDTASTSVTPAFVNATDCAAGTFTGCRLTGTSSAKWTGTNVSLTTDLLGRTAKATPSMGVLEYYISTGSIGGGVGKMIGGN